MSYEIHVDIPGGKTQKLTTTDRHLADMTIEALSRWLQSDRGISLWQTGNAECIHALPAHIRARERANKVYGKA